MTYTPRRKGPHRSTLHRLTSSLCRLLPHALLRRLQFVLDMPDQRLPSVTALSMDLLLPRHPHRNAQPVPPPRSCFCLQQHGVPSLSVPPIGARQTVTTVCSQFPLWFFFSFLHFVCYPLSPLYSCTIQYKHKVKRAERERERVVCTAVRRGTQRYSIVYSLCACFHPVVASSFGASPTPRQTPRT